MKEIVGSFAISNLVLKKINFWIQEFNSWIQFQKISRGASSTAATSKVELFVIIVNGFQPLTIITKSPTLDVPAALDPPLVSSLNRVF